MKRVVLSIIFACAIVAGKAQTSVSDAFSKSYVYETGKQYAKAVEVMEKVYDATSYSVNLRLGWLTYLSGDYTKSQTYYKKAVALEPKSIEARLGCAYPVSAMQNWDDVIKLYQEILVIDPSNSLVNYRMASIYYARKDFDKAAAYAEKVLKLYPFDYDSNYLLGQIFISQGKLKEAKVCLTNALYYNPSSADVKALLEKV